MARIFLALALMLAFSFHLQAQINEPENSRKKINTYLAELEKMGFSGAVHVEIDGKTAVSNGYGYRNLERKEKNTTNTVFDIGSLTKQFTASAILKLEMQGKLKTSDTIIKYFKNVPPDKSFITIHDLLRHQSGLQSSVGKDFDPVTEVDFIDTVMKSPLRFKPATDFSYSNIGYSLLAIIIEKVSGQSYEQYLYENLWKPAGMETTGYSRPKFTPDLIAVGYGENNSVWGKPTDKKWNGPEPYLNLKGNGGILSTIEDLYKWHKVMMTEKILSKAEKQKFYHPELRSNEDESGYYAYGWDIHKTDRNTLVIWHNGTNRIFYADFMQFIDENTALIYLSNKSNIDFNDLNFTLAKIIFEKDYEPAVPILHTEANQKFSREIIETVLSKGLDEAKRKYESRPSKIDILEDMLNEEGFDLISQEKYDEAISVFTMNTIANPKSTIAFEGLGEALMNKGETEAATKNLQKSLELNPNNRNAKDLLQKLKK